MTRWDAIVIGAGPAGSTAARELARRGASVLLVDRGRFPRYKVCGGCLNPRSLGVLRRVGLASLAHELGAVPLHRLRLGHRGRSAGVNLPTGAGLSREAFDQALIEAAIAAGVQFRPDTSVSVLPVDSPECRRLRLGREEAETRVVIAASGLGSRIEASEPAGDWKPGSRLGAGVMVPAGMTPLERGTIAMACGSGGYVGQVIVEDGRADVAAALDPVAVKQAGGIGPLASDILRESGLPHFAGIADLDWKGTPHLTRTSKRLGGERAFRVGDAAGYVEPFTGEGMAWALAGGVAVAPLALRAIRGWEPSLVSQWEATYRRSVTSRQFVCKLTAAVLRRPLTTRLLVGLLGTVPRTASPFLRFMYRA